MQIMDFFKDFLKDINDNLGLSFPKISSCWGYLNQLFRPDVAGKYMIGETY
jgi:hypothetical protein